MEFAVLRRGEERMKMICFDLGGVLLEILHTMEERLALRDGDRRG